MALVVPTGPQPLRCCAPSVNLAVPHDSAIDPECSLVADLNY